MITAQHIKDRWPKLQEHFSASSVGKPLLLGVLVNRSLLDAVPEVKLRQPSIKDSMYTCDICPERVWLGPEQSKIRADSTVACTICYIVLVKLGLMPPVTVALNPNEETIPRRRSM